jgi:hypothetical protein
MYNCQHSLREQSQKFALFKEDMGGTCPLILQVADSAQESDVVSFEVRVAEQATANQS